MDEGGLYRGNRSPSIRLGQMKERVHIIAFLFVLMFVASCSDDAALDNAVRIHASLANTPTKGLASDDSGVRNSNFSGPLDIELVRVDENVPGSSYPFFQNTGSSIIARMETPDAYGRREISFTSAAQYYRNEADHILYASWYPTSGVYEPTTSAVTFNIDGATDILYGSVVEGNKTDGFEDIVFNHALCQYNVYAYNMGGDDVDWGEITDITIENVQQNLLLTLPKTGSGDYDFSFSGQQSISLAASDNGIYWNPDPDGDGKIGTDGPGSVGMQKIATYLAPPPASGFITMGITTTKGVPYQQISIARNFQTGYAYDIVLRFTSHGIINAEVSVGDWQHYELPGGDRIIHDVEADMYYDLSAYMTANCYIVPSGNYGYSFVGNVKGKSTTPTVSNMDSPGYIDVLWCDNENIWRPDNEGHNYFELAGHTLSKNRIMFKVGDPNSSSKVLPAEKRGNVVIAGYRDSSKNEILWSWHIWLNDEVSTVGLTNGFLALDRNLGASTPGAPGLYYQWGRKDPFAPGHFSTSTSPVTPAESAKHPDVFYGAGQTNWFSGSFSDFINGSFISDDIDVSSIYDPCPAGYYVPDSRMWNTGAIAHYQTSYNSGSSVSLGIHGSVVEFPLNQGYLDENGNKQTGFPLFIWSISTNKGGTQPMAFLYPESGRSPAEPVTHTTYGGAIRCIAKAPAAYKDLSEAQTANTYIISGDGYYKFKANVAGNGVSTLVTDRGNELDITGSKWGTLEAVVPRFTPSKVDYLWYQPALDAEVPQNIDNVCVKILNGGTVDANGYVYLEVEDWVPGNLIVAAYDGGDNILWSWHLWLTDKPADEGNGLYALMDRNLGATMKGNASVTETNALATYGMYYQWGRKDPFPGPPSPTCADVVAYKNGDFIDHEQHVSSASSPWFEYTGSSWTRKTELNEVQGPVSIKSAARNPLDYIYVTSLTGTRYHWMNGYVEDDRYKVLWGYAVEDGYYGNKPDKTMYDPCPPGYIVAHHWVYWNVPSQSNSGSVFTKPENLSPTGSFGYTCSRFASGNYYPLAGRRGHNGGYEYVGSNGFIWGSTPKSGGRMFVFGADISRKDEFYDAKGTPLYGTMGVFKDSGGGSKTITDAGADQAYGQSVRCLKQ